MQAEKWSIHLRVLGAFLLVQAAVLCLSLAVLKAAPEQGARGVLLVGLGGLALAAAAGFAVAEGLARSRRELAASKEGLLRLVAHGARNPLAAIIGFGERLLMTATDPRDKRSLEGLLRAASIIDLMISDLSDLAAVERGALRISPDDMDLMEVLRAVEARLRLLCEQRKVDLRLEPAPAALAMRGDEKRLEQVLHDVLSNAVNYTPSGGSVLVSAAQAGSRLEVAVRDTGIGIRPEDIPRVFDKYYQAENAKVMRPGGFGVAMYVSRAIVRAHGGELSVASELGKGSTFTLSLPTGLEAGRPATSAG